VFFFSPFKISPDQFIWSTTTTTTITIKSNLKKFCVSLLIFIERNLVVFIESLCYDHDHDRDASHAQALIAKDEHLVSPCCGLYGKRNEIDC
jgi:hypothetical protein